jgi:hypothetical protein
MAKKKSTDKLQQIIRHLVFETKLHRNPQWKADSLELFELLYGPARNKETYLRKLQDYQEEYTLHTPIHPSWTWEELKDECIWWFIGHLLLTDLFDYPGISKELRRAIAKEIANKYPSLKEQAEGLARSAKKKFLPKQWKTRCEVWDLVEDNNYSMEDVALTLRRPLSTAYRLYNEAGKHIIGDSFRGKKRDRATDWNLFDEHELNYIRLVEWIQAERIFPRAEQLRLLEEYLSVNHVMVVESPRRKKRKRAIKLEPLEYRGTTGAYTRVMGNWCKHLESLLDLEKIHFIRGRLKECGKIPQDCRALCLFCQVQGELHFLETDEFRKTIQALGINELWKERCKRSLVENTLYRGKFFYDY